MTYDETKKSFESLFNNEMNVNEMRDFYLV